MPQLKRTVTIEPATPMKRSKYTIRRQVAMNTRALSYKLLNNTSLGAHNHFELTTGLLNMDANLAYLKMNYNPVNATATRVLIYIPKQAGTDVGNLGFTSFPDPQTFSVLYDSQKHTVNTTDGRIQCFSKYVNLKNRLYESSATTATRNQLMAYVFTDGPATTYLSTNVGYRVKN